MAEQDGIDTPVVAIVGVLSGILIFALVVLLLVVFHHVETGQRMAKDIDRPPTELSNLVARQQARLASYERIDPQKKVYAIPIDRAMELVLAELAGGEKAAPAEAPPGAAKETENED